MGAKNNRYSRFIKSGFIKRKSNIFFSKIIDLLFRKIEFDNESITNLNEYYDRGISVFASFESSQTSMLILVNLLKKHNMKLPELALGFTPYTIQIISGFFERVSMILKKALFRKKYEIFEDYDVIADTVRENPIIISILSKKLFFRRYIEIKSDIFQYLVDIQKDINVPIYLFPKIMFWNMNPERTKTLISSKATGDRGLISGLFTKLKSQTPSFIRISTPINLMEEIRNSQSDDTAHIVRILRNKLLEIYNHNKRTVLGPVIKSQSEMMEKVLFHKNVMDVINELTIEENIPETKLRKKAYEYFKEIAANFSIIYVKYFEKVLQYVFRKIFDGIHYDKDFFIKIREAAQRGPLIIIPSHKSHMDYLIVSCIFYQNRLIPPHIVAGSNLTFFPMGHLFRKSGAFFMRRSFKGKQLYAAIFKQYVKTLINEGYSIEFFIEGGRTRTGKLIRPRMGILKYLIESIEEGYNRDMVFLPLSINYERILEENAYHDELKGKEKKKESTSQLVKGRKLLKKKYGKVYIEFSDLISYNEMKKELGQREDITSDIANIIIKKISDITLITPTSLATAAILFSPSTGFTRSVLKEKVILMYDYLKFMNIKMSPSLKEISNCDQVIDYIIQIYLNDHIINKKETDSDNGNKKEIYTVNTDYRGRVNFYKNNIIHFFLPISFAAISISQYSVQGTITLKKITEKYDRLVKIFSYEFIYPEIMDNSPMIIKTIIQYLKDKSIINQKGNSIITAENKVNDLNFFAEIIQDFFESYYIVLQTIKDTDNIRIAKKDLIQEIRKKGIEMYKQGPVKLVESLSMSNYLNALKLFISTGSVTEEERNKKDTFFRISINSETEKIGKTISCYIDYIEKTG